MSAQSRQKRSKKSGIISTFFDSIPESLLLVDGEGRVLFANKGFAKRVGRPLEKIIGFTLFDLFPKNVAELRTSHIKRVFETRSIQIFEDEREGRYYKAYMIPIFNRKGEVHLVGIYAADVTEEKKTLELLRMEKEQMISIFNSLDHPIYVSDMDTFDVLFANDYLKRMLGRDPTGGKCFREFQGFESLCDFCPNSTLRELKGEPYRWEYYNPVLKRYFDITDKVIRWYDGRDVKLEVAIDITERKNAEMALKLSEEIFRSSIANLREGFVRLTLDGKIVFVNSAYARIYGFLSPEEITRSEKNFFKDLFVNQKDGERLLELLKKEGQIENFESERKRKDGQRIWVSTNARVVKGEYGEISFIEATEVDVTEKKKAEETLEEERRKFSVLVENLPFGVVLCDISGKYLYVNPKFTEITGYTIEDVPDGRTFLKKAYPDKGLRQEASSLWKKDVEKMRIGESTPRTFSVTCKDGTVKRFTITTVYVAEGLFVMSFEDVTEKERNEILLRESEKRFRSIFENAQEGIFQSTIDGKIQIANPRLVEMLGYSSFEELKESIKDARTQVYVNPEDRDRLIRTIEREGKVVNFETQLLRKDGKIIWVNISAWPVYDENGNLVSIQGIQEDVTGRKKKEEELNSLREQFLQAQKMEAIGRLAGGIAHDFSNILTVIIGTCQLALMDLKNEERIKKSLEKIINSAEKASSLTKQLLAYSRKQLMQLRIIDLNELLGDMEEMIRRLLGEDIEVITYLSPDLGRVKADPTQLQQVILNLVVNAKDAMPQGGKLIIETYNVELTEDYARTHFGVSPGKYVMLSITDTGCGIPKDIMPHIFEPFFTTKGKGEGTGLGLSTVYGIVKQLSGHIYVYSEEGRGTTFKIYLPSVKEKEDVKEKEEIQERVVLPSNVNLLLIEDDEEVLKVTSEMLRNSGFKVLEAKNEDEALKVASDFKERIDVIVTDVVIPGIKAPALVAKIKKIHPEAKILYMSGYTENVISHQGIVFPGVNFIQKPFALEDLKTKIIELLKKG